MMSTRKTARNITHLNEPDKPTSGKRSILVAKQTKQEVKFTKKRIGKGHRNRNIEMTFKLIIQRRINCNSVIIKSSISYHKPATNVYKKLNRSKDDGERNKRPTRTRSGAVPPPHLCDLATEITERKCDTCCKYHTGCYFTLKRDQLLKK